MSIARAILDTVKRDPITKAMEALLNENTARRDKWMSEKTHLQETIEAFEALGAHVSVDTGFEINIRIAGDKECFLNCWKLWRALGIRLSPPEKGATEIYQHIEPFGVKIWFHFTSTVCKRVKIGTEMRAVDIYETQCGPALEVPLLEGDDIPL